MTGGSPSSDRSRIVVVIGEPNASRVSCAVVNDRDDTLPSLVCALYGEGIGTEGVDCPVGGGHVTCECIQSTVQRRTSLGS